MAFANTSWLVLGNAAADVNDNAMIVFFSSLQVVRLVLGSIKVSLLEPMLLQMRRKCRELDGE